MKNPNLLFLTFFVTSSVFSQDIHFLKGIVQNDSIDVSDIIVANKNLKLITKSSQLGVFELPVRIGDSIKFSAIHINPILLLVTEELLEKEK